ncbi:MAG: hypothetical protein ACI4U3_07870 [Traorella sp.]
MAKTKKQGNKKPHIVLVLLLIILIIPVTLLGAILYSSLEDSSKPVVGTRYENQLDPQITQENLTMLEEALKEFDGVEKVEVNLKTARLSILLNTNDDTSKDGIKKIIQQAYAKVNDILPIETYFTNHYEEDGSYVKMYDLQIDAYNVVEEENQIHYIITKTGAQEEELLQLVSSAKDKDVANEVLNQDKGE